MFLKRNFFHWNGQISVDLSVFLFLCSDVIWVLFMLFSCLDQVWNIFEIDKLLIHYRLLWYWLDSFVSLSIKRVMLKNRFKTMNRIWLKQSNWIEINHVELIDEKYLNIGRVPHGIIGLFSCYSSFRTTNWIGRISTLSITDHDSMATTGRRSSKWENHWIFGSLPSQWVRGWKSLVIPQHHSRGTSVPLLDFCINSWTVCLKLCPLHYVVSSQI